MQCDGQRPCNECSRRKVSCVYLANENETQRQAAKRKHDELSESHGELLQLYETLAYQDTGLAQAVFNRIRNGEHVSDIIRHLRTKEDHQQANADSIELHLYQKLLVLLAQSTAPLKTLADIAISVRNRRITFNLPSGYLEPTQADRIVTLEYLHEVLDGVRLSLPAPVDGLARRPMGRFETPDGTYDGPLYWVPAAPWTDLVSSDEAVSHLISIVISYVTSYWR